MPDMNSGLNLESDNKMSFTNVLYQYDFNKKDFFKYDLK